MIFRAVGAAAEPLPAILVPESGAPGTIGPIRVAWSVTIAGTRQTIEVQLWPPFDWLGLAQRPVDVRALPNGYRIALRLI